jgi:Ca2+-binding RTX toxin-like protein
VSGGSGADSVVGSAADGRLAGGAGADTLDGGGGLDTVRYDLLSPGAPLPVRGAVVDLTAGTAVDPWGDDTLRRFEHAWGSHGADSMTGAAVANTRTWLRGLGGADTLRAASAGTMITADHAADPGGVRADLAAGTVLDGWGDRDALVLVAHLRGGSFADSVLGGAAANWLDGGAGDDTLDGAAGADTLLGGAGDDVFVVDNASDQALELAGEGSDTLLASVSWTLRANIEALVLAGAADIYGFGNTLANRIAGNAGANRLIGGAGGDTLDGGAGRDTLYGGEGDDVFVVQGAEDAVVEWSGQGFDAVVADSGAAGYALPPHVEALFLAGATTHGTGNGLANWIAGNSLGNTLGAGGGDDTLLGGGGDDVLRGEAGADLFVFDPGMGQDRIADFQPGTDRLLLRGFGVADFSRFAALTVDGGEGALIELGGGQRLLLQGVLEARLSAADVLFG